MRNVVIIFWITILENLAIAKPARQSSDWNPNEGSARLAVDGWKNTDYHMNSCTMTSGSEETEWWNVDLQQLFRIRRILIVNREDCCGSFQVNILYTVLHIARISIYFFTWSIYILTKISDNYFEKLYRCSEINLCAVSFTTSGADLFTSEISLYFTYFTYILHLYIHIHFSYNKTKTRFWEITRSSFFITVHCNFHIRV